MCPERPCGVGGHVEKVHLVLGRGCEPLHSVLEYHGFAPQNRGGFPNASPRQNLIPDRARAVPSSKESSHLFLSCCEQPRIGLEPWTRCLKLRDKSAAFLIFPTLVNAGRVRSAILGGNSFYCQGVFIRFPDASVCHCHEWSLAAFLGRWAYLGGPWGILGVPGGSRWIHACF